jgi:hypothetical protein
MSDILKECRRLKQEFIKNEIQRIPSYEWRYYEGEKYIDAAMYDKIEQKADEYFTSCYLRMNKENET